MNYQEKYLKYKNKYLSLRQNLKGGSGSGSTISTQTLLDLFEIKFKLEEEKEKEQNIEYLSKLNKLIDTVAKALLNKQTSLDTTNNITLNEILVLFNTYKSLNLFSQTSLTKLLNDIKTKLKNSQ
jgi:excinuclease UvrABC ATPase subunit